MTTKKLEKHGVSTDDLAAGDKFKVRKLTIKKGCTVKLHSHNHRTEQWIVVFGNGIVCVDELTRVVGLGGHITIPRAKKHSITASSAELIMIEVQLGSCDESDIQGCEDA